MATDQHIIKTITNETPITVENRKNQIADIEKLIEDLENDKQAIYNEILSPTTDELKLLLDAKAETFDKPNTVGSGGDGGNDPFVDYSNFLSDPPEDSVMTDSSTCDTSIVPSSNVDVWSIQAWVWDEFLTPSGHYETVYEYKGTGWDNDTAIEGLITDYDYSWDLIYNKSICNQGTYGIQSRILNLKSALNVLKNDVAKLEQLPGIFGKHID